MIFTADTGSTFTIFLYWQALSAESHSEIHPIALNGADSDELHRLTVQEHKQWNSAVSYYANNLTQRDLLFDEGMEAIKNQLEDSEASSDLSNTQISADLKSVLLGAEPIYRKHWWTQHDVQNRQWIAELSPLIKQYGESISTSLVNIFAEPWPHPPVQVDAVAYANWAGAYTSLDPVRITIATTNSANQGTAALEMVFHEASHGMIKQVMAAITDAEMQLSTQRANGKIHRRRDLWHEVLFYTTGQLVAERIPGYSPFAEKNGLWIRAWPRTDRALIEQDWQPHMDGSVPLRAALAKLVQELTPTTLK